MRLKSVQNVFGSVCCRRRNRLNSSHQSKPTTGGFSAASARGRRFRRASAYARIAAAPDGAASKPLRFRCSPGKSSRRPTSEHRLRLVLPAMLGTTQATARWGWAGSRGRYRHRPCRPGRRFAACGTRQGEHAFLERHSRTFQRVTARTRASASGVLRTYAVDSGRANNGPAHSPDHKRTSAQRVAQWTITRTFSEPRNRRSGQTVASHRGKPERRIHPVQGTSRRNRDIPARSGPNCSFWFCASRRFGTVIRTGRAAERKQQVVRGHGSPAAHGGSRVGTGRRR